VKVVLTLATDGRYGIHRDELYYVVAGRRLAWGYVDFPPLTPLVTRLFTTKHVNLVVLRAPAVATGVGVILLTAAMARHLGGSPRAQWVAGLSAATCSFFVGANGLLQTVSFDILAWALALYFLVRLVTSDEPRWWLGIGAAVGLGMETKYTMPAFLLGLAVAVAASPRRRDLRTPWPWAGGAVALLLAAPNIAWQMTHHWPSLEFLRDQNQRVRSENPTTTFLFEQLGSMGPFVIALVVIGVRFAWRDVQLRSLVFVAAVVEAFYLLSHGKGYYALDALPVLLALGAVGLDHWRSRSNVIVVGLAVWTLVGLPIALPILPQRTMLAIGLDDVRDDYSAELGWHRVAGEIARAHRDVPDATVLADSFSIAGAVDVYGQDLGLPHAVSGHNTYELWWPHDTKIDVVLSVGFPAVQLQRWFADVREVGRIPDVDTIDQEQRYKPIVVARQPKISADQLRRAVKRYR
jgi:hypothetical protein